MPAMPKGEAWMQVSNSNPFYAAGPFFNSASNPVTITGTDANGNVEGVTADGVKVLADPTGSMAGFAIADVLTPQDKAATGYDPSSHQINQLAIAVATYRASGMLKGDVTSSFIDALKQSIATTGGYPSNPALLMAKSAQQNLLTPQTYSALFSILNSPSQPTS